MGKNNLTNQAFNCLTDKQIAYNMRFIYNYTTMFAYTHLIDLKTLTGKI